MITKNIIEFGYGDVAVGSDSINQTMTFQQFEPCRKCGEVVPESVAFIGEKVVLKISYEDYCEFDKNLRQVAGKEISQFAFKGYIFDFTRFNEESIKVCKKHLEKAMKWYFFCMAA